MSHDLDLKQMFVAVTGAQGVGKSTFCQQLRSEVEKAAKVPAQLLSGLGEEIRRQGIVVGNQATGDSVAAIYAAHMLRERNAPAGIVILDRCTVDAAAYVSSLPSMSPAHKAMYHEASWLMSQRLSHVIHLTKTGVFAPIKVLHESQEFRDAVAEAIPSIIRQFEIPCSELYAADPDAIPNATSRILKLWQTF